jgi:LacI family trehalose operon transcriptional repressor
MKQGYEQVASVLTPQTTALVCATDTLALGASKYLQEQRIDNLQVASVGSTPLMKFLHPEIITVDPGYAESGRQAAAQLIEQINGAQSRVRSSFPPIFHNPIKRFIVIFA